MGTAIKNIDEIRKTDGFIRLANELCCELLCLDLFELRVFFTAVAKTNGCAEAGILYDVTSADLSNRLGLSSRQARRTLFEVTEDLQSRIITLPLDGRSLECSEKTLSFPLISGIYHQKRLERVSISFAPEIIPFISKIKERFTKIYLPSFADFTNTYTVKLYLMLYQFINTWRCFKTWTGVRRVLGCDGISAYDEFGCFNQRVLKPSIANINKSQAALFSVKLKIKKDGRKVDVLDFDIVQKKPSEILHYVIDYQLTRDQASMLADWLLGKNKKKLVILNQILEKVNEVTFIDWLYKNNISSNGNFSGCNDEQTKERLITDVLLIPEKLEKLHDEWLKPLGMSLKYVPIEFNDSIDNTDTEEADRINDLLALAKPEDSSIVERKEKEATAFMSDKQRFLLAEIFGGQRTPPVCVVEGRLWSRSWAWDEVNKRGVEFSTPWDLLEEMSVEEKVDFFVDEFRNKKIAAQACAVVCKFDNRFKFFVKG